MPTHHSEVHTLAGYRLVRKLGEGARSEAFLGVPIGTTPEQRPEARSRRAVVLKIFREQVDRANIGTELAALAAADLTHCARLLDVATAASGQPVPILERVKRGSVAGLLRERDSIDCGEAVTLIAPIAATMTALHTRGIAHSNLGVSSVHLGDGGEPVLLGFGHSAIFDAGLSAAALDVEAAVVSDRDDLANFASAVLDHVRAGSEDARIRELQAWLGSLRGGRRFEFAGELEDRLFDLADPRPINFAHVSGATNSVPSRIGLPASAGTVVHQEDRPEFRRDRRSKRREGSHAATTDGGSLLEGVTNAVLTNPLAQVKTRAINVLRGVRKPLWAVAGAVAVALTLAIALLPAAGHPTRSAEAHRTTSSPVSTPSPFPAIGDPLSAVAALMRARSECIRQRSVSCLDHVDEPASQALSDDTELVQRIQRGAEVPATATAVASNPQLVQRLGGSALVVLDPTSGPASALLIREKAGWRIRSFEAEKPVQP